MMASKLHWNSNESLSGCALCLKQSSVESPDSLNRDVPARFVRRSLSRLSAFVPRSSVNGPDGKTDITDDGAI